MTSNCSSSSCVKVRTRRDVFHQSMLIIPQDQRSFSYLLRPDGFHKEIVPMLPAYHELEWLSRARETFTVGSPDCLVNDRCLLNTPPLLNCLSSCLITDENTRFKESNNFTVLTNERDLCILVKDLLGKTIKIYCPCL